MHREAELGIRRLILTVYTFVFLLSLLGITFAGYLPHDAMQLRTSFSIYSIIFLLMSATALVGAVRVSTDYKDSRFNG